MLLPLEEDFKTHALTRDHAENMRNPVKRTAVFVKACSTQVRGANSWFSRPSSNQEASLVRIGISRVVRGWLQMDTPC